MARIEIFAEEHVLGALDLWRGTEHIGLSSADEPARLADFLHRNEGCSFVALDAGAVVVGACLCGHDGRRGYIHHLAVAESHRRAGMGAGLLERCLAALRERGIQKAHAFVYAANPYGERFWAARGWIRREELALYSKEI